MAATPGVGSGSPSRSADRGASRGSFAITIAHTIPPRPHTWSFAITIAQTPQSRAPVRRSALRSSNSCDCVEHLLEMLDAQLRVQQFSDAIEAVRLDLGGAR
jgi:hypothetical protein